MLRRSSACLFVLSTIFLARAAAALTQPEGDPQGTTIPIGGSLQSLFVSRNEGIDAVADALTVPETFVPGCDLTFEVLQRDSAYNDSFGWYNVTGQKPTIDELHEFLSCNDPIGTVKVLNIKNDPAYAGGQIGFYEATGPCGTLQDYLNIFYSEKKYNTDAGPRYPYVHLITYNSTVTANAFYFAWEDLLSGGDNDFNDLTTFVTGISCAGGGGACQTGAPGVCADGTLQCQTGVLTCIPLVAPSNETCDGFDNDCNAEVDDGDLCGAEEVCDKGTCVPKCGGEFPCDPGKECNAGICVDPECIPVSCREGTKCVKGECVDPCNGVTCPKGQACIAGNCIDPCLVITCDDSQVCTGGACIDKCQCAGCAAQSQCQPDGLCIPDACLGVTCPEGQYCIADGTCADACTGVVCPAGQVCTMGQCVADPNATGSGGAGGNGVGGFGVGGGGPGNGGAGGSGASGGAATGGGGAASGGSGGSGSAGGGCGCKTAGSSPEGTTWLFAASALCTAIARRRRSRRA
jgi:MYXO-CTERM domain-containing protein